MQSVVERFNKLRNVRNWEWKKLADELELSVSMLMMVRRGERQLSERAEHRLSQLEISAGIINFARPTPQTSEGPTVYPKHQPQIYELKDEADKKIALAKLKEQVQTMQTQLNKIASTIEELEK